MQKNALFAMSLVALFGAGCISITTTEPTAKAPAAPVEQPAPAAAEPVDALSVTDQAAASSTRIATVSVTKPSFVVIHSDVGGALGPVVGQSALLQKGTAFDVEIALPVKEETYYWAMLHTDDSDGVFDETKDLPTKDGNGNIVVQRFEGTK